jgi:hypothetical protein
MTAPPSPSWVMWEARAAEGRTQDLLAWALAQAGPGAQVYISADRVVVIYPVTISAASPGLSEPPSELLARPAYQWEFERVR